MSETKFEFKRGLSMEDSRHSTRRIRTTSGGSKYERGMSVTSVKDEEVSPGYTGLCDSFS